LPTNTTKTQPSETCEAAPKTVTAPAPAGKRQSGRDKRDKSDKPSRDKNLRGDKAVKRPAKAEERKAKELAAAEAERVAAKVEQQRELQAKAELKQAEEQKRRSEAERKAKTVYGTYSALALADSNANGIDSDKVPMPSRKTQPADRLLGG
jgi:hypothetical protein